MEIPGAGRARRGSGEGREVCEYRGSDQNRYVFLVPRVAKLHIVGRDLHIETGEVAGRLAAV